MERHSSWTPAGAAQVLTARELLRDTHSVGETYFLTSNAGQSSRFHPHPLPGTSGPLCVPLSQALQVEGVSVLFPTGRATSSVFLCVCIKITAVGKSSDRVTHSLPEYHTSATRSGVSS